MEMCKDTAIIQMVLHQTHPYSVVASTVLHLTARTVGLRALAPHNYRYYRVPRRRIERSASFPF